MDLGGEIEVVDRAQEQSGLGHDVTGSLAVAMIRRAEILPLDDFGEADNRVQRRLDLVDQLTERIRVAQHVCRRLAPRRRRRVPLRDAAIASEAAVGRIERGQAADLPGPRNKSLAADLHFSVAEGRPPREGPYDLLVDAIAFAVLDPRNRSADQRTPRRALHPGDVAARTALPAEHRRGLLGDREGSVALRFAAAPAPLDPRDDLAERGTGRPRCRLRLFCWRGFRLRWPGGFRSRLSGSFRVQGFDELPRLLICDVEQRAPLWSVESGRREHRR